MCRHHIEEIMALQQENAQLWEGNRSWRPGNETPVEVKAKLVAFEIPKATNVNAQQDTHPGDEYIGEAVATIQEPFRPRHLEVIVAFNWKSLTIEKYDNISDPNTHLDVYITRV